MKKINLEAAERVNAEDDFSVSEENYSGLVRSIEDGIFIIRNGYICLRHFFTEPLQHDVISSAAGETGAKKSLDAGCRDHRKAGGVVQEKS